MYVQNKFHKSSKLALTLPKKSYGEGKMMRSIVEVKLKKITMKTWNYKIKCTKMNILFIKGCQSLLGP